jgi:hypothetical protein
MNLTLDQAAVFSALPLRSLRHEYPNHIMHVLNGPADVRSPRSLHPVFYGCYDWHSAVHGFWLLARCAQAHPGLPRHDEIVRLFDEHFTPELMQEEVAYFEAQGRPSFERPYGYAWIFALSQALADWRHPRAAMWHDALEPLAQLLRQRCLRYFALLTYPIRVGTHYNSAFALKLSLDFARHRQDEALKRALVATSSRYYAADHDYPARFEPGGDEFLSAALIEALLMSQVLATGPFESWFEGFLPDLAHLPNLMNPAQVSDRSDPKIAHLDGLNLSRAWCMKGIADHLRPGSAQDTALRQAAVAHTQASLAHVSSGHYAGEHWLATFALLALA